MMHDLLIKNARIYDGLGNPPQSGDLAVKDGRIAAVGQDLGAARETVDAARIGADAGHHRHAYPLRRADHLGPDGQPVAGAGRDHV